MNKEAPVADSSLGLSSVLFIVFLVLKLTGLVAWSWWWVLAPMWIPAVAVILVLAFIGVVILLGGMDAIEF